MSELERALLSLGRELDVPAAPDLVPSVLRALGAPAARRRPRRRLVLALAVLALAALLATLAIPDARSGLLRFLQIGGERIELVDELPEVQPEPAELDLDAALGERVSLGEAQAACRIRPARARRAPGSRLSRGREGPSGSSTDALRPSACSSRRRRELEVDEQFILKKLAGAGTHVEEATVRGVPAYFLSGEPHVVMLLDEHGIPYQETARLARDVLVWEERGRTIRLEGDLTRAEAVSLAESLR